MCLFPHVPHQQTPKDIIAEAFRHFLSGSIQEVLIDVSAQELSIQMFQVYPTLPWTVPDPHLNEWIIPVGPWFQRIWVQPGVPMAAALKAVFPQAIGSAITRRSQEFPDVLILTVEDVAGFRATRFDGTFGFMRFRECDFVRRLPLTVVSLSQGLVIVKKGTDTKIPDVRLILGSMIPEGGMATDMWGFPLDQGMLCPDAVSFCCPCSETPVCAYGCQMSLDGMSTPAMT